MKIAALVINVQFFNTLTRILQVNSFKLVFFIRAANLLLISANQLSLELTHSYPLSSLFVCG